MTDATPEQMLSDSTLVGCAIRGLPSSAVNQDKSKFRYINSLDREYSINPCIINSVTFDISRYGKYTHTLEFVNRISEREAIERVEEYLSVPLTEKYYTKIADNLFHEYPWKKAKKIFKCRGDCLTDCKFLEETKIVNGNMTFFIGS
jgi:hypothetical protein